MTKTIGSLDWNKGLGRVHWLIGTRMVEVFLENVHLVRWYPRHQRILCLSGPEKYTKHLTAFDEDGGKAWTVEAPAGYDFSYMTEDRSGAPLVVAVSALEVDGWMDWHFHVDPSTGELRRGAPAY